MELCGTPSHILQLYHTLSIKKYQYKICTNFISVDSVFTKKYTTFAHTATSVPVRRHRCFLFLSRPKGFPLFTPWKIPGNHRDSEKSAYGWFFCISNGKKHNCSTLSNRKHKTPYLHLQVIMIICSWWRLGIVSEFCKNLLDFSILFRYNLSFSTFSWFWSDAIGSFDTWLKIEGWLWKPV